jgi:aldehyde:ferredoxin oxidoreductase
MLHGWTGRLLTIDLSSRTAEAVSLDPDLLRLELGGKGLAGRLFDPCATLPWDHPDSPLLICAGPLVGTNAPTSGRAHVLCRSPLTGTVGDASVGGRLGTELKRSGFDGIALTGRAAGWTGIEIKGDRVEFSDASPLLGLPLGAVADRLDGRGSIAAVGVAAERGAAFASLMVDRHFAAARGGIGLCFGRKRVKYLTVRGTGEVAVADPAALKQARDDIRRQLAACPILLGDQGIGNLGTPALYDLIAARHMLPTANFSKTAFPPAGDLGAAALRLAYEPERTGCRGCSILCKKRGRDGAALPEYESLAHFTALLENDDLDLARRANTACNELGLDTISAAATLACYAELTGEPVNGERVLELLEAIGRGTGIGIALGRGSLRYATAAGRPAASISVKGLELPAYDPRGAYGMALAYVTSTRGGCHLRAYPIGHEILGKPVATDRFSFAGKARIVKIAEDANAVIDSLTACKFAFFGSSLEEYAAAFQAVTGEPQSASGLSRLGERIYFRERIFNARNGFTAADDDLPPRFFEEPGTAGPGFEVPPIDRAAFLAARARYYKVRGLDGSGMPTREKAAELGLEELLTAPDHPIPPAPFPAREGGGRGACGPPFLAGRGWGVGDG